MPPARLVCYAPRSRPHAELVHFAWQQNIHGKFALPKTEKAARELFTGATARLNALTTKANEPARSRTSDERKALDLSRLLVHWMINGKPSRAAKQKELAKKTEV